MKTEDKAGGPTDPMTGLDELVRILYENNAEKKHYLEVVHPLKEYLARYSHTVTPQGGAPDTPLTSEQAANVRSTKEVTRELTLLTETRKN